MADHANGIPTEDPPSYASPWRLEFRSYASWGKRPNVDRPASYGPNRDWVIGDKGPSPKQGYHKEYHPGQDD